MTALAATSLPASSRVQTASGNIHLAARILALLVILDPSGDPILTMNPAVKAVGEGIRAAIIGVLGLMLVLGWSSLANGIRVNRTARAGLALSVLAALAALLHGVMANIPRNAVREAMALLPLGIIPVLATFNDRQRRSLALFAAHALVCVCTVKLMLGQFFHWQVYHSLSYKVLFRQSPLLLFPYALFLMRYFRRTGGRWNTVLLLLAMLGMITAQARALLVAAVVVTAVLTLRMASPRKILGFAAVAFVAALAMTYVSDNAIERAIGSWSGDVYQSGVDYRLEQARVLAGRLRAKPLQGYGLGYFTSGYQTYEELANPQLLELDLPNFATKTGLVLFAIYLGGYVLCASAYRRLSLDPAGREIGLSYLLLILGLLIYSLFQTFHASMLFWIFYAFGFAFLFGAPAPRPAPASASS